MKRHFIFQVFFFILPNFSLKNFPLGFSFIFMNQKGLLPHSALFEIWHLSVKFRTQKGGRSEFWFRLQDKSHCSLIAELRFLVAQFVMGSIMFWNLVWLLQYFWRIWFIITFLAWKWLFLTWKVVSRTDNLRQNKRVKKFDYVKCTLRNIKESLRSFLESLKYRLFVCRQRTNLHASNFLPFTLSQLIGHWQYLQSIFHCYLFLLFIKKLRVIFQSQILVLWMQANYARTSWPFRFEKNSSEISESLIQLGFKIITIN